MQAGAAVVWPSGSFGLQSLNKSRNKVSLCLLLARQGLLVGRGRLALRLVRPASTPWEDSDSAVLVKFDAENDKSILRELAALRSDVAELDTQRLLVDVRWTDGGSKR